MTNAQRVHLWDEINRYVVACGGDPSKHVYGNTLRQVAVSQVEKIVREVEATWANDMRKVAEADVCGAQCDFESECLLLKGHDGAHETQHGCIFYDAPNNDDLPGSVAVMTTEQLRAVISSQSSAIFDSKDEITRLRADLARVTAERNGAIEQMLASPSRRARS